MSDEKEVFRNFESCTKLNSLNRKKFSERLVISVSFLNNLKNFYEFSDFIPYRFDEYNEVQENFLSICEKNYIKLQENLDNHREITTDWATDVNKLYNKMVEWSPVKTI